MRPQALPVLPIHSCPNFPTMRMSKKACDHHSCPKACIVAQVFFEKSCNQREFLQRLDDEQSSETSRMPPSGMRHILEPQKPEHPRFPTENHILFDATFEGLASLALSGNSVKDFSSRKTQVPWKTVPLLDGLPSSSAERHNELRFQDTASPRTPKQWHIMMKAKEKSFTALPFRAIFDFLYR